jgi:hypothetical protein
MKTFLVDWGENANGGRFALVQATSMEKAFWDADSIGSPFSISELRIPKDTDGIRYVEIDIPTEQYAGTPIPECGDFQQSWEFMLEMIAS